MDQDLLIASLTAAVEGRPDDVPLRLHLAGLLVEAGRSSDAIGHVALVLQSHPGNAEARSLMARILADGTPSETDSGSEADPGQAAGSGAASGRVGVDRNGAERPGAGQPDAGPAGAGRPDAERASAERAGAVEAGGGDSGDGGDPEGRPAGQDGVDGVDWSRYEQDLADVVPPRYVGGGAGGAGGTAAPLGDGVEAVGGELDRVFDVEVSSVRLADVGGLEEVKRRLELAFLGPLRNPELRRLYGKSLRGGLLLYGPPGCGKTFLAKAVAGELGAKFMSLSIVDVLDMWIGNAERNLHELFQLARRNAPCAVFLDEIDALGFKRGRMTSSAMRTTVNQLLAELDGMEGSNEGVFVLAATNAPWDVDEALRRPGRLDRMLLVLPPDADARAAILSYHLRERPIAGIDLRRVVARTDGFSGADLAHLCETAAEYALRDSIESGEVRMIVQRDLERALGEVRPSTGPWFEKARNVAMFANDGGDYDDLAAYLRARKLL